MTMTRSTSARTFLCLCFFLGGCYEATPKYESATQRFYGMCDASAAVTLSDQLFAVADDEDNVLRIYNVDTGGEPLASFDLSARLGIEAPPRKNKAKAAKKAKAPPELDLEGAAVYQGQAYWITSHGRNSSGKIKEERLRFFATTLGTEEIPMEVIGEAYDQLLTDLINHPDLKDFNLAAAAELAPKEFGGLNIEGLSERLEGGLWIGFRNPLPQEQALMVPLLNPQQVIHGYTAELGPPVLLDLDGRGIRDIILWRGKYIIAAGSYDSRNNSALYLWDGFNKPQRVNLNPATITNPEAFFASKTRDQVMLLNDQGSVMIDGKECKRLKQAELKYFTGSWVEVLE